jgi:DNA-binding MarR family transcriptional regulator
VDTPTANERKALTFISTNPRATLKGIAKNLGMKYRGVQDLVARLVRAGYLLRAGHGRGQQLLVNDKSKQRVGDLLVIYLTIGGDHRLPQPAPWLKHEMTAW